MILNDSNSTNGLKARFQRYQSQRLLVVSAAVILAVAVIDVAVDKFMNSNRRDFALGVTRSHRGTSCRC